jgi:preprotein translocase subunit SecE
METSLKNPIKFFNEAYVELKKSSWLPRQQAVGSTAVVLILVSIMAAYIAIVDGVLSIILGALIGR